MVRLKGKKGKTWREYILSSSIVIQSCQTLSAELGVLENRTLALLGSMSLAWGRNGSGFGFGTVGGKG